MINKERARQTNIRNCKKYYERHKKIRNKKNQEYIEKNREKRLAYLKEYYLKNKEKLKPTRNKYFKKNKSKILNQMKINAKKWAKQNRDKVNKQNLKKAEKLAKPLNLNGHEYKNYLQSWSEEVRKRDQNKCQICGNKAKVSHHILFKSKHPLLSFNMNNGLAICDSCHYELHRLNS